MSEKYLLVLFLLFYSLIGFAEAGLSEEQIQSQETDQSNCYQQIVNECIYKCNQTSNNKDCNSLCELNAKNECLQAGE